MPPRTKLSDLQAKLVSEIIAFAQNQNLEKGAHLVEENLAKEFGVSRSPVRSALFYLQKHGLVEAQSNRGFFLADHAKNLNMRELKVPESEDDRLYERLTRDKLKGILRDVASEAELMRRYRVTRGLLTRVLQRLSHEGIVQRSHGYGWLFLPTFDSEAAHDESYRFRAIYEPAALLEPKFKVDEKRLARVRQVHEKIVKTNGRTITDVEMFQVNAEFHEMLAAFSGNRFILQAAEQHNRLRQLIERRSLTAQRAVESCKEHLAIMDAIDKGDRRSAASLLRQHIEIALELDWPSELLPARQRLNKASA